MSSVVKRNAPLTNADFETGDLTGWNVSGDAKVTSQANDSAGIKPHSGSYQLRLGNGGSASQSFAVAPGTALTLNAYSNSFQSSQAVKVTIQFGDQPVIVLGNYSSGGNKWGQLNYTTLAPSGATSATVTFAANPRAIRLDDIVISEVNAPIEDTAFVYLDGRPLPIRLDTEGDLPSALAPFTLTWGTKTPWDDLEPCILAISLIDPTGAYSKNQANIQGRTLEIYNSQQDPMPMFSGTITSAKLTNLNENGRTRLDVTASDKAWNIKTDTAKGPTADDRVYKGYQWAGSDFFNWVGERFRADGIASYASVAGGVYGSDPLATERISVYDVMKNKRSDHSTTPPTIRFGQATYVTSFDSQQANNVWLTYLSLPWNRTLTLTGHLIIMPDDYFNTAFDGDMMKSTIIEQARNIQIDKTATVTPPDDFYSQAEIKYYSRSVTNPGVSTTEQDKGSTVMTFSQDQSRILRIDTGSREGENVLDIDMDEYVNAEGSAVSDDMNIAKFDVSGIIAAVHENNSRLRLPELTFYSKRVKSIWRYIPKPCRLIILGSKFERFFPDIHGPWISISGVVTFNPKNPKGAWSHTINVFPSPMPDSYGTPTIADLKAINDADGQLSNCNYPLGAFRYVTNTSNPS
ncbi:hypothetical protein [Bifidobacterium crudilactis]|jgi:hypothetical protein|uniref:CBM-cenC domain-containing protein n=4 Tax=Actinomycetes TaxID=1760 RepID=A0A971CYJ1_9BIFI|nr:hypothetical protein [Bifidobacterium crudilactis]MCI1868617.1 hypothetical protein [Bifidobacterium crudilactis]MDN5972673.1 hypothetical protein [Bifidobacterium crudilactis]MDN6000609.1 hypothetical protein [Bifidobacterium crudilactis]MDN6467480.1 hypothetical protein [Bifidobacterium crudilactis]MDN6522033.1 hypothetical protein [Bifidobacterium crudilactis]